MYKYSFMAVLALAISAFTNEAQADACLDACKSVRNNCDTNCTGMGGYGSPNYRDCTKRCLNAEVSCNEKCRNKDKK